MTRIRLGAGPLPRPVPSARGLAALAIVVAAFATGSPARAQWGMGDGFWGFNPENGGRVADAINQRSLISGQAAFDRRHTPRGVPNGPNSYMNNVRDVGFTDRFDISTRRGVSGSGIARTTPRPRETPAPAPAPRPTLALAGFFNQALQVIWPADAPRDGDLGAKRVASDRASLVVFDEARARGLASVSSVTEARALLLDYGRPALEKLRETTPIQVSDQFHRFLLGLYDALAQAGQPR